MTRLKQFVTTHPRLAMWLVLALGMVAILFVTSRGAGLSPAQLAALAALTVGLAGACARIIVWE